MFQFELKKKIQNITNGHLKYYYDNMVVKIL